MSVSSGVVRITLCYFKGCLSAQGLVDTVVDSLVRIIFDILKGLHHPSGWSIGHRSDSLVRIFDTLKGLHQPSG